MGPRHLLPIKASANRSLVLPSLETYSAIEIPYIDFVFSDRRWMANEDNMIDKLYFLIDLIRRSTPFSLI